MVVEAALRNYEDYLIGKKVLKLKNPIHVDVSTSIEKGSFKELERKKDIEAAKEADAIAIVQYAITSILGWTPEEAFNHLDGNIIETLKLGPIIKHIQFPKDLSPKKDFWWIVHKAFPLQAGYNQHDRVLKMYERVLKGEIKNFPRLIFEGVEGRERLYTVFHYYITNNIPASSIEELYEVFGDEVKAKKMLKDAQLYYAYRSQFNCSLDLLHDSLGADGNNLLYRNQQYMELIRRMERQGS